MLPGFRIEKLIHRKACAQYGNRQQVADLDVANKQETGDQVRDILRFEHYAQQQAKTNGRQNTARR